MSTKFEGHVFPAATFIILGILWTVAPVIKFFRSLHSEQKKQYVSTATTGYRCNTFPKLTPDGVMLLSISSIGFVISLIYGLQRDLQNNIQHAAIYFFLGMFALISILMFNRCPLPPSSDYAALLLAIAMEMLIFAFHTHGRNDLDKHVHNMLVIILAAIIFVTLNEAYQPTIPIWSLVRGIMFTLKGTWLLQIGFILYNPFTSNESWDVNDHHVIMKATNVFACHIAGNVLFAVLIGWLIWRKQIKQMA